MVKLKRALIFSTVWPEPMSSAAGVRQFQWVRALLDRFDEVVLSSPSKMKSESDWGALSLPERVVCLPLQMNDSSVKKTLAELAPSLVLFDRFILEEQFGHLVYEACPDALVLLETQDLHFLRRARESQKETLLEQRASFNPSLLRTETALRETAAIERVDYSFLVSRAEAKILSEHFSMGEEKVAWLPFSYEETQQPNSITPFSSRAGFVWVGNFRHAPNMDGLRWFRKEVWPKIKARLPEATIDVFGAYPSEEVMQCHDPKGGFRVLGHAAHLGTVFSSPRVNLAPLRFGAGVKGKILEGFRYGVPCVTTWIGEEGLFREGVSFPGLVANSSDAFVEASVRLHSDFALWRHCAQALPEIMDEHFNESKIKAYLLQMIDRLLEKKRMDNLPSWRSRMLRHEFLNSHKYFSKWIETKEKQAREHA